MENVKLKMQQTMLKWDTEVETWRGSETEREKEKTVEKLAQFSYVFMVFLVYFLARVKVGMCLVRLSISQFSNYLDKTWHTGSLICSLHFSRE